MRHWLRARGPRARFDGAGGARRRAGYWPDGGGLVTADIRDPAAIGRALRGVEVVCHQAAMVGLGVDLGDLPAYTDVNVTGTAVLFEQMGSEHIRAGAGPSMVVYGEGGYRARRTVRSGRPRARASRPAARQVRGPLPVLRQACAPSRYRNPRRWTRVTPTRSARLRRNSSRRLGRPHRRQRRGTALSTNVYAEDAAKHALRGRGGHLPLGARNGQAPRVFEDGAQRRDFVHVTDVAAANLAALQAGGQAVNAYNVASGEAHTIWEMASALAGAFGGPLPASPANTGSATSATWWPRPSWPGASWVSGPRPGSRPGWRSSRGHR